MKYLLLFLFSLFFISDFASANPRFQNVDVSFSVLALDDQSKSLTGFSISGEHFIDQDVLLHGGFEKVTKSPSEVSSLTIGAGYRHIYQENLHLLAGGELVKSTSDSGSGNTSDTEIGLKFQARFFPANRTQLMALFRIIDGQSIFGGEAQYFFEENLSAGGSVEFGKNDHVSLGLKYWY